MDLEKQIRSAKKIMKSDEAELCYTMTCAVIVVALFVVSLCFLSSWYHARTTPVHGFSTISVSVSLASIDYASTKRGSASLNAAFNVRIELNSGVDSGINYGDTVMFLRHRGANVGASPIAGAHVRTTRVMGLLLSLVSNADTSSSAFYSDVVSGGVLKLQAYVRFTGKGHIAKVFEVRSVAEATCDVWIDLSSRVLLYGECHENAPEKGRP